MKVFKIGSRWSDTGKVEKTVLDIFDKHRIVFAGRETDSIKSKVKEGNLIVVSDGLEIVRVGKILSLPRKITDFTMFDLADKKRFDFSDWVIGFRVSLFKLDNHERLTTKMGTFHKVIKDAKKIEEIYNQKLLKSS